MRSLWLFVGCVALGLRWVAADAAEIVVVRRGWHLDVALEAGDLDPALAPVGEIFTGARYLTFGFGDRRYLLARRRHVPDVLAALWPGPGLMLVTGLNSTPETAFGRTQVMRLAVTAQGLEAAEAFIRQSFQHTQVLAPGPYPGAVYMAASADYSAAHTCNTWVAEVLRRAGLPVRTGGVIFAGPLWRKIRKLDAVNRAAWCHRNTPPSSPTAPPPSSSREAADCCC